MSGYDIIDNPIKLDIPYQLYSPIIFDNKTYSSDGIGEKMLFLELRIQYKDYMQDEHINKYVFGPPYVNQIFKDTIDSVEIAMSDGSKEILYFWNFISIEDSNICIHTEPVNFKSKSNSIIKWLFTPEMAFIHEKEIRAD